MLLVAQLIMKHKQPIVPHFKCECRRLIMMVSDGSMSVLVACSWIDGIHLKRGQWQNENFPMIFCIFCSFHLYCRHYCTCHHSAVAIFVPKATLSSARGGQHNCAPLFRQRTSTTRDKLKHIWRHTSHAQPMWGACSILWQCFTAVEAHFGQHSAVGKWEPLMGIVE